MRRRSILQLMPAVTLVACTSTTSNGVTTFTLDTHKVDTDGTAILQALASMLLAPSVALLLGPNLIVAQAAIAGAQATLAGFDQITGGSMSATYDKQKAQATILSFISDVQQVLTLTQQIMPKIGVSTTATTVGNYTAAVQALLSFLQVAIGLSSVTLKPQMTEAQALQIATH
jgi:hypothetical protein